MDRDSFRIGATWVEKRSTSASKAAGEANLLSIDEAGRERLKTLIDQARLLVNGNNILENF